MADFCRERQKRKGAFHHIPHLSLADLATLLQSCTAFVFPSQEEGFARVLPMAMAVGLPIIASHQSGATTLVKDGVQGIIIKAQDPQHIADAMTQVYIDPDLIGKWGKLQFKKVSLITNDRIMAIACSMPTLVNFPTKSCHPHH
jgi:glycosyltransferase involved in cell wall biosynthesis